MNGKRYFIKSKSGKWSDLVVRNMPPSGMFGVDYITAPEGSEYYSDFDVTDGIATLNPSKMSARIASEIAAKAAQDEADSNERVIRSAIKQRVTDYVTQLNGANIDGISSLADAKAVLKGMRTILVNLVEDIGKIAQRTI